MEMFPFANLIILSTGLCTLGLLGLSISDIFAERRRIRGRIAQQRQLKLNLPVAPAPAADQPALTVREQLLKAA